MNRRAFLKSAALLAGLISVSDAYSNNEKLRTVEVIHNGGWKKVRMYEIQPGDIFRFADDIKHTYCAKDKPHLNGKVWSITASLVY